MSEIVAIDVKNTFFNFDTVSNKVGTNRARSAPARVRVVKGSLLLPVSGLSVEFIKITLRRADGGKLGLDLQHTDFNRGLEVMAVQPGGAVDAWNRQCSSEARMILPGDSIVAVNDACDAEIMLTECREKLLLAMKLKPGPKRCCENVLAQNVSENSACVSGNCEFQTHQRLCSELWCGVAPFQPPVCEVNPWCLAYGSVPYPAFWHGQVHVPTGLMEFGEKICTDDASTVSGSWAPSEETASSGDLEPEHGSLSVSACQTVEWMEDRKKLTSKKIRLTKTHCSQIGRFAFTLHPVKVSTARGGSSFYASGGRATLEVKCLSENLWDSMRLSCVTVGPRSQQVDHSFGRDGMICRVPGVWELLGSADEEGVNMLFHFESSS